MTKTPSSNARTFSQIPILAAAIFVMHASLATAAQVQISAEPIAQFQAQPIGEKIGELTWQGGLVLTGPAAFGGISGLTFVTQNQWIAVTDRGQFISGTLEFEQGQIIGFGNVEMSPIKNSTGNPLPRNYSRDAEAIDTIYREGQVVAVRVSFENLTRVADFDLQDMRPVGPAREVAIPPWLVKLRTNGSLESACIATDASPIAGSTLLITEDERDANGDHSAWLLGNQDKGPIALKSANGFNPTDCAFLPNGDLLVLERGTDFLSFKMQVRRIAANTVAPKALLDGEIILFGSGGDIDNMEALAIRIAEDGSTRMVLMSDDNFNGWERTLLLEFELPN